MDGWECIIPIVLIIAGTIIAAVLNKKKREQQITTLQANITQCKRHVKSTGFSASNEIIYYSPTLRLPFIELGVDTKNQLLAFYHNGYSKVDVIHFSELVGSEIILDKSTVIRSGSTGGAIVGGLIGGTTGAVIGNSVARSEDVANELRIKIVTTNINHPMIFLNLITRPVRRNNPEFKRLVNFAEQVQGTLESVGHTNRMTQQQMLPGYYGSPPQYLQQSPSAVINPYDSDRFLQSGYPQGQVYPTEQRYSPPMPSYQVPPESPKPETELDQPNHFPNIQPIPPGQDSDLSRE